MDNPIKMDDLGVSPYFRKHPNLPQTFLPHKVAAPSISVGQTKPVTTLLVAMMLALGGEIFFAEEKTTCFVSLGIHAWYIYLTWFLW